jgi:SAM-dependent methyltransferase
MKMDYPWPVPPGFTEKPVWTGREFRIGDTYSSILVYEVAASGWTDELTEFHEETAGSDHFIDRASRQHALEQLGYLKSDAPIVLDVGCSSGFMLRLMREQLPHAAIIGSDFVRRSLENLATDLPDVPLLQFDLMRCPLPDNSVDAVILLNVLEHIKDDSAAMLQVYRILKPGGIAVVEVPSNPRLYDVYDKMLMHYRRYSLGALQEIARNVGFNIITQSHLGFFLYPGFWLTKMRNKRFLSDESVVHEQVVAQNIHSTARNRMFHELMRVELSIGRRIAYPFGIRCLMTLGKAMMRS